MLSTQSFVVPQPGWQPIEFRQLAHAFGRAILSSLIKARAPEASPLANIMAIRPDQSIYWAPEVGQAQLLTQSGRLDAAELLAFAYCAHGLGLTESRDFDLSGPVRLLLHGHTFNLDGSVRVVVDGASLQLHRAEPELRIEMKREGGAVTSTMSDPAGSAEMHRPVIIKGEGLAGHYMFAWHDGDEGKSELPDFWPPAADIPVAHQFLEESSDQVTVAMNLIGEVAPQFTTWIAESVRGIAASPRAADDPFTSGSAMYRPGCISLAFPINVEGLAELLIHEASHQHFNMLNLISPMSTGREDAEYYSTLKQRNRDLKTILLTFHAVANMAIYWRLLIDGKGFTPEREKGLRTMCNHARSLVAHLKTSSGLTTTGEEFWRGHIAEMQRLKVI